MDRSECLLRAIYPTGCDGHYGNTLRLTGWSVRVNPPQEVMSSLLGRRLLEGSHVTALWIHGPKDVVDRAVFATCVHRL